MCASFLQKEGPLVVKPFEDVCFPSDPASPTPRCQFYMKWCPRWLLAPVLSNRASEIGLVSSPDHFRDAALVGIDEEDGVIFPDATRFTGFAIDYTVQRGKVSNWPAIRRAHFEFNSLPGFEAKERLRSRCGKIEIFSSDVSGEEKSECVEFHFY